LQTVPEHNRPVQVTLRWHKKTTEKESNLQQLSRSKTREYSSGPIAHTKNPRSQEISPPSKLLPLFALLLKETKILQKKLIHQNPTFLSLSLSRDPCDPIQIRQT